MITPVPSAEHAQMSAELEQTLLTDLAEINVQSRNESIALRSYNGAGDVVGGITAETSYDWVFIKILWVAKSHRGQGTGRELLLAAEDQGRQLGCHAAWLETSNPSAHQFYQSLGYEEFSTLENTTGQTPPDHKRWFMKKKL